MAAGGYAHHFGGRWICNLFAFDVEGISNGRDFARNIIDNLKKKKTACDPVGRLPSFQLKWERKLK